MDAVSIFSASVAGAALASVLACVPGLHVYNVLGLLALGVHATGWDIGPQIVVPLVAGMMVGYAMLNTVPSVLLAAPDESALFTVLPGQKYLLRGHGHRGVLITAAGGLAGVFLLVLLVGPLAPRVVPLVRAVVRPHQHWMLWCVIAFMLLSEWPKGGRLGQGGWAKFRSGWSSLGTGLLTFLLSGLLGFVVLYRSPVSATVAFQNLMPAFVGLFTVPWLAVNLASGVRIPPQHVRAGALLDAGRLLKGAVAGGLGGGFAAFMPVVTGGVGGFLAGHATALRDDRTFLVSQGASKMVYYVGGLLLLFVPGLHLTRGGAAWMLRGLYAPRTQADYYTVLAAIALAGSVSFLLVSPLTRATIRLMERFGYGRLSAASMAAVLLLVVGVTGWAGLGVMLVATGIGLLPVVFGSRRMNCLGVILLPIACNMSGVGAVVAGWLGLL